MRKFRIMSACILFSTLATHPTKADKVIIGVNVYDELFIPKESQDAEIKRLAEYGVKTMRTSLQKGSTYFVSQAYQHGIGAIVIVYPCYGSKAKSTGTWSQQPLSGTTPQEFMEYHKPLFDELEAAGVRLTAIELGNEINDPDFNGDFPRPGSGRTLGLKDLNNHNDPEAPAIVAGYRVYLQVAAALKNWRDHSKLNQKTPIVLAGMADMGPPGPKSWSGGLGVSAPDAIEFLRQLGVDKLVDAYAVHVYPNADPNDPIPHRMKHLDRMFAACRTDTKPCWLTEWGFGNGQSCPIDDRTRVKLVQAERDAFKEYVKTGRLAAIVFYNWSGVPGPKEDPSGIFRCGALTDAGKLALSPM